MRRRLAVAGTALALLPAAASCGEQPDPLRIAVQTECQGGFTGVSEQELAGAFLPLVERGAQLSGPSPTDGVEHVRIAGRSVQVRVACTESFAPTYALLQLRQLVEEWHPDVVVGSGLSEQDGIMVRDLGKRYPGVTFLLTAPIAQEITLYRPAPNVFRVVPDNAQSVAGLASYAYRTLGWRRAAVVGEAFTDDWEQAAGFMAEFCALGGAATRDDGRAWTHPAAAAARYGSSVDGVAVVGSWALPTAFLRATARRSDPASRLVVGGSAVETPAKLAVPGSDLDGVVVASTLPLAGGPPRWRRYLASFAKAYPGLPADTGAGGLAVRYRDGVEAVVSALERIGGDPGPDGVRLRRALDAMTVQMAPAPATFDRNRQVVASVYLSRLGTRGVANARTMSIVRGVEQSYGGIFGPPKSAPTFTGTACDPGATPPPWAG